MHDVHTNNNVSRPMCDELTILTITTLTITTQFVWNKIKTF